MKKRYVALALAGALAAALFKPVLASQGSGCLPTTGTVSGLTMTQNINSALAAMTSMFSGASAPSTDCSAAPVKGQQWLDTSVTPNLVKQFDGNSWIVIGAIDATNHVWTPPVGGGSATVTAATTTNICAAPAALQTISGTTPITSFGSDCVIGARKTLIFNSATPITYNSVSMILPGQRSYTATPGDMADAIYLGSGNWRVKDFAKIDGSSVTNPAVPIGTIIMGTYGTIPPKTQYGNGQTLPRALYPDYLAAVTRTQSASLTAGNNTITSVAFTRGLGPGMPLEGTGIQSGTVISSITLNTIVMSKTATANGSQNVTAFLTGYGNSGDTTTVGTPNCSGQVIAGLDPDGSYLSQATAINSRQGAREVVLDATQIPAHIHPNTLSDGGHSHSYVRPLYNQGGTSGPGGASLSSDSPNTGTSTSNVSINNAYNTGGGNAHPNVQPTMIAECVVVVSP